MRSNMRFLLVALFASLASPAAIAQVSLADCLTAIEMPWRVPSIAAGTVGGIGITYPGAVRDPTQLGAAGDIDYWNLHLSADGSTRSSSFPSPYTSATVPNA